MKRNYGLKLTLGLLTLGVLPVLGGGAEAQTTAIGPYYATPSWDQTLACTTLANCPRFIVLSNFSSAAVLDRETGLVWEQSPSPSPATWLFAQIICLFSVTGGREGWHLPTVQELTSLKQNGLSLVAIRSAMCRTPLTGRLLRSPSIRAQHG